MNADGSDRVQVTRNGAANFCPFFHPDGRRIIFASNLGDPEGRNFDLYLIDIDGTNLEQVTVDESFDGFPDVLSGWKATGLRLPTATEKFAAKPTFSSPIGWSRPVWRTTLGSSLATRFPAPILLRPPHPIGRT